MLVNMIMVIMSMVMMVMCHTLSGEVFEKKSA